MRVSRKNEVSTGVESLFTIKNMQSAGVDTSFQKNRVDLHL